MLAVVLSTGAHEPELVFATRVCISEVFASICSEKDAKLGEEISGAEAKVIDVKEAPDPYSAR